MRQKKHDIEPYLLWNINRKSRVSNSVITAGRYMRKRGLCCRLSHSGSPIILVFLDSDRRYPIPKGTPSTGAKNAQGWQEFAIFD